MQLGADKRARHVKQRARERERERERERDRQTGGAYKVIFCTLELFAALHGYNGSRLGLCLAQWLAVMCPSVSRVTLVRDTYYTTGAATSLES